MTDKRNRRRFAFTLTEIAIVLGVTGTVLSGIWYGASSVYEARKTAQAIDEIRFVIDKVHDLEIVNPSVLTVKDDPGCTVGSRLCPPPYCVGPPVGPPPATVCGAAPACLVVSGPGPCTLTGVSCVTGSETLSNTENTNLDVAGGTAAGLFPAEMVSPTGAVSSPWGSGDVTLSITQTTNGCANNPGLTASVFAGLSPGMSVNIQAMGGYVPPTNGSFTTPTSVTLAITDVPLAACIRLTSTFGAELLNMGMQKYCINAGCSYGDTSLTPAKSADFNLNNAKYWCGSGATVTGTDYMVMTFSTQTPN